MKRQYTKWDWMPQAIGLVVLFLLAGLIELAILG